MTVSVSFVYIYQYFGIVHLPVMKVVFVYISLMSIAVYIYRAALPATAGGT